MSGFDLSNFLASFFDEARERLSSINQHLVNFESGKISDDEFVDLRRDAHTIKGSALMLGVNDIGGVGHLFEDAIEQLIEHPEWRTPAMIQFLFDLHDKLEDRLKDPESNELLEPDALRGSYNQLVEALQTTGEGDEMPAEAGDAPSGLIGADEAAEWKKGREDKREPVSDTIADDLDISTLLEELPDELLEELPDELLEELPDELSGLEEISAETTPLAEMADKPEETAPLTDMADKPEESFESISLTPLPEADSGGLDDFKPDVSQIEMKAIGQRKSSGRFLRVDAERLEELSNHVIELSTEQSRGESVENVMQSLHLEMRALRRDWQQFKTELSTGNESTLEASMRGLDDAIAGHVRKTKYFVDEYRHGQARSGLMLKDLRDQVLSLMLKPLDSIFSTFPRAIRDVAVRADKKVNLQIAGESVEIDQGVAETLVEPIVHLLNNAVAHGIESPEERRNAGKPEDGQITIIAKQSGNEVRIEVVDDGRGIDSEIVKRSAVERGVTTQVEADAMASAEILEMIFRPGFSTHSDVTDLAGRGIGMNVVQDALRRLTGAIRIHTKVGEGTRFILSLPVRIAVQHALLFRMGDQTFGMLTHMIEQALPLKKQTLEKGAGGKDFIRYGDHLVPIVDLRKMMTGDQSALSDYPYVLISEHIEGFVGIVIDELLDDHEIVVRDLDSYIKRYQPQGLMGNTIAADGSVILLLEPYGIKEMGRTSPDDDFSIVVEDQDRISLNVLLVDDSLIARKVEQGILESIGFNVDTAIDGLDALAKLDSGTYDMVITDLEMPRLDGFGLVRRMRNQPKYEDLPILIISTRESAEDRMRGLEAGADAYLVKQQLDGESLMKSINMLVGH
ncbi:response regulator [Pseudomonadota bacterium]